MRESMKHQGRAAGDRVRAPGADRALRPRPPVHQDRRRHARGGRQGRQGRARRASAASTTPPATRRSSIVGNFDPKQAEALARSVFGGWSKGTVDKPVDATPYKRTGPAYIGVIGKEEPQLTVAIGYPAPAGVDGQQGARMVLAEMINTRDGRRPVQARLDLRRVRRPHATARARPPYQMGGTVDAARAGESIKAMREGLDMLRAGGEQFDDRLRARAPQDHLDPARRVDGDRRARGAARRSSRPSACRRATTTRCSSRSRRCRPRRSAR